MRARAQSAWQRKLCACGGSNCLRLEQGYFGCSSLFNLGLQLTFSINPLLAVIQHVYICSKCSMAHGFFQQATLLAATLLAHRGLAHAPLSSTDISAFDTPALEHHIWLPVYSLPAHFMHEQLYCL